MPLLETVQERQVALTVLNTAILTAWIKSQTNVLDESEKVKILEEDNIHKIDGNYAALLRKLKEWDIHIADSGKYTTLGILTVELDKRAGELYKRFNRFLSDVAIQIGLSSKIDEDLIRPTKFLLHPYALIKDILLRIVLKILSNTGSINESSKKYITVLNKFIDALHKLPELTEKDNWYLLDRNTEPSQFSTFFLKNMKTWIPQITTMVKEVAEINVIRNTVQTNRQVILKAQQHTARYLYFHLKHALNEKPDPMDFNEQWLFTYLKNVELKIMGLNGSNSLQNIWALEAAQTDFSQNSIMITREHIDAVCTALQANKDKLNLKAEELDRIIKLYDALYDITFIEDMVGEIDELTTVTGCLVFLMKYVDAIALGECIQIYWKQCMAACTDKSTDSTNPTILDAVINMTDVPSLETLKNLPFGNLANDEVIGTMADNIAIRMGKIVRGFVTHKCDNVIHNHKAYLSSSVFRKEFLLDKTENSTVNSLFSCLGIERKDLTNFLVYLNQNTNESWLYVGMEAEKILTNNELSNRLQFLLESSGSIFDLNAYHAPFKALPVLAKELRTTLKKNNADLSVLARSNNDLLDLASNQNFPYLKIYEERIKSYKEGLKKSGDLLFQATINDKDFVLAYFQYRYMEENNDLVYIRNKQTTIKAIAEYRQLGIIFSSSENGSIKTEEDSCNSCKYPDTIIKIDYITNNVIETSIRPEEEVIPENRTILQKNIKKSRQNNLSVVTQDKTSLCHILFKDNPQKIDIFNIFLCDDSLLASMGCKEILNIQDNVKRNNDILHKEDNDIDGFIIAKARGYVFSGIRDFIQNKHINKIGKNFIESIARTQDNLIYNYLHDQIFIDYIDSGINNKLICISMANENIETSSFKNIFKIKNDSHGKNISCFLLTENNPETEENEFLAFRENYFYNYKEVDQGKFEYAGFEVHSVPDDGNSALNALDIASRDEFIYILKQGIKKPENLKLLAYDLFEESRNDLNNDERRINEYIVRLNNDGYPIGKYALHIYAREKEFSLYIYDKQISDGVQEIKMDKLTSFSFPKSKIQMDIVYDGRNHYDKLIHTNDCPRENARIYLKELEERIKLTTCCHPKEGQLLEDYKSYLNECQRKNVFVIENIVKLNQNSARSKFQSSFIKNRQIQYRKLLNKVNTEFSTELERCKDQVALADELRDMNNRTLLFCAVQKGNIDEVKCLLEKGASVVSRNVPDFSVGFMLTVINNFTYVLSDDKYKWSLSYYNTLTDDPVLIQVEEIAGLKEFLNDNYGKMSIDSICQKCYVLIKPYHEKIHFSTPLTLAAQNAGFSLDNPLYFTMLEYADKEAARLVPSQKLETTYPALYYFAMKFVARIRAHLKNYINTRKERWNDSYYEFCNFIYSGEIFPRGKELALVYQSVIDAGKTHNYGEMLDNLCVIQEHANWTLNSVLHNKLSEILEEAIKWKKKHARQYHEEYDRYRISLKENESHDLVMNKKSIETNEEMILIEKSKLDDERIMPNMKLVRDKQIILDVNEKIHLKSALTTESTFTSSSTFTLSKGAEPDRLFSKKYIDPGILHNNEAEEINESEFTIKSQSIT